MRLPCALMLVAAAVAFSLENPGDDLSPQTRNPDQAAEQSNRTASTLAGMSHAWDCQLHHDFFSSDFHGASSAHHTSLDSAPASLRGFISLSSKESKRDECQDAGVDVAILLDSSDSVLRPGHYTSRSKPLAQAVARKVLAVSGSNIVIGTFGNGHQLGEEVGSGNMLALEELLNKLKPRGMHT